ncbi:MAG: hypothetical protein C7B43_17060 [Sulfobacillus benefaciens]|jgi:predicted transcriptional regulator|uniref:Uncharacterized protein n=1 Tax=Sulfobacillus benefaciens TaxID=453960 RepID=A0A2T2WSY8_9FIRM|nr:MAG: hypothetical protein C7B43_17060 [Sulfobacillus benefaciens]HBQ96320.1 hypothetical protein [Sulfobacillus sp.]
MIIPFKYRMDVPISNSLAGKLSNYAQDMQTDEESIILEALTMYLESEPCQLIHTPRITAGLRPRK